MRGFVLALVLSLAAVPGRAAEAVTVFGAASLTDALEDAGAAFEAKTGTRVRFSLASTSVLARQIELGAPADIFLSASEAWMDYLAERDLIEADTRLSPIGNRLVLIAPADAAPPTRPVDRALDLAGLLGPDGRLATGDPDHVPAGIYARQALEHLGLWAVAEPRLARTDNVRAALALVQRGEAPLGIVYTTDAKIAGGVATVGVFRADSHTPITYPTAILKGRRGPAVDALYTFLTGAEGGAIFARFGFAQTP